MERLNRKYGIFFGLLFILYVIWLFLPITYDQSSYLVITDQDGTRMVKPRPDTTIRNYNNNYFILEKGKKPFFHSYIPFWPSQDVERQDFYFYLTDSLNISPYNEETFFTEYENNVNAILTYLNVGYQVSFHFGGFKSVFLLNKETLENHMLWQTLYLNFKGISSDWKFKNTVFIRNQDDYGHEADNYKDSFRQRFINGSNYLLDNPFQFVHEFLHNVTIFTQDHVGKQDTIDINKDSIIQIDHIMERTVKPCKLYIYMNDMVLYSQNTSIKDNLKTTWPEGIKKDHCCPYSVVYFKYTNRAIQMIHLKKVLSAIKHIDRLSIIDDCLKLLNTAVIDTFTFTQAVYCENEMIQYAAADENPINFKFNMMGFFPFFGSSSQKTPPKPVRLSLPTDEAYIHRRIAADYQIMVRNAIFILNHLMQKEYYGPTNSQILEKTLSEYIQKYKKNFWVQKSLISHMKEKITFSYTTSDAQGNPHQYSTNMVQNRINIGDFHSIRYNQATKNLNYYRREVKLLDSLSMTIVGLYQIKMDSALYAPTIKFSISGRTKNGSNTNHFHSPLTNYKYRINDVYSISYDHKLDKAVLYKNQTIVRTLSSTVDENFQIKLNDIIDITPPCSGYMYEIKVNQNRNVLVDVYDGNSKIQGVDDVYRFTKIISAIRLVPRNQNSNYKENKVQLNERNFILNTSIRCTKRYNEVLEYKPTIRCTNFSYCFEINVPRGISITAMINEENNQNAKRKVNTNIYCLSTVPKSILLTYKNEKGEAKQSRLAIDTKDQNFNFNYKECTITYKNILKLR